MSRFPKIMAGLLILTLLLLVIVDLILYRQKITGNAFPGNLGEGRDNQIPGKITSSPVVESEIYKVTRIIDGDTIVLSSGQTVRYIGVDAPEKNSCFAAQATDENKKLLLGKEVRVQKDMSENDRYHRALRFIWIGNIFVNDYLIRQGFAVAKAYPPDVKYQEEFNQAQSEATSLNRGLWATCENPR